MARPLIDRARREEIEAIFEPAIDLAPEERDRWLAVRCSTDARLRAEVDSLIAGHDREKGVLEHGAAAAAEAFVRLDAGRRIGEYRVVRELGRGGMGVVYLAERDDDQFEQRVAVKLLHASQDSDELRRRFLAERQILATLRHERIARLLDGGVTDEHLPFLVMEYVDGVPISTFAAHGKLDIAARLRLFGEICSAVHHAHQNLIVHRDIKPANILVSRDGGVKLLDFGIAKLLSADVVAPGRPLTRTGTRAMTPEYASPEQIRGDTISTASDVYALGVVLYELLSGQRPYQLVSGAPHELADIICTRTPERPSTVVPDDRTRRALRGDLDAIVMMALRKDPTDRYGSVDLLWADIRRYLDGMPVQAHRGSRLYHARKFFGRHRVESVATALVAASLAVGAGVAVRQASVAGRERDRAERARAAAGESLKQSEGVTGFLVGLFDATTPLPKTKGVTTDELMRRGITQLELARGQPLLQARMLEAIARVHIMQGHLPKARTALERSLSLRVAQLGPDHVEVGSALLYLGEVMRRIGQYHAADSLTRRALAIRTAAFGPMHPTNVPALEQLAGIALYLSDLRGAEALSRRALEIDRATLERNDRELGNSIESHALIVRRLGAMTQAETELREAAEVYRAAEGDPSPSAANTQLRLADIALQARGDTAHAETLMRSALTTLRGALGDDHVRTSWAMEDLADVLSSTGRVDEAERLSLAGLEIQRRTFGPRHVNVANYGRVLVTVYERAGRFAEAERLQRELIGIYEETVGRNHTAYAGALGALADIQTDRGHYDDALASRLQSIEIRRRIFGDRSAIYGIDLPYLARTYAHKGDYRTADSLFRVALTNLRQYVDDSHYDVRRVCLLMAERYRLEGRSRRPFPVRPASDPSPERVACPSSLD